jgi:YggT family protein
MMALDSYARFVLAMKSVVFYVGVAVALVCALDWMVRTRRVNPFGPVARFCRRFVDPMMRPVERTLLRVGGQPATAPFWAALTAIVLLILFVSLLQFVGSVMAQVLFGMSRPAAVPVILLAWLFALLRLALIVRVLSSWLGARAQHSRWVRWSYPLTEWMLAPLRRIIPTIGMMDITPLVAWFGLGLLEHVLASMFPLA